MRALIHPITQVLMALFSLFLVSCGSADPAPNTVDSQPGVIYQPQVTIKNNSYKDIMVGLRGPETLFVSIPARSSKSISLVSGNYKYAATAANTNTVSGFKFFGSNEHYLWNLSVD